MRESVEVKLHAGTKGFVEDKDEAKRLRVNTIMPALNDEKLVVIDFGEVTSSTQSFVHALVGEPLQKFGEAALERLEFRNCGAQVKSLVQLVVDYSLGGFTGATAPMEVATGATAKKPSEKSIVTTAKVPPARRHAVPPRHRKTK